MTSLERQCRDMRLTALLNEAYYRRLADTRSTWDLALRTTSAVVGAASVAAAIRDTVPNLWQGMVLIAATASAAGPILRLAESARRWSDLAAQWTAVVGEFDRLAAQEMSEKERHDFSIDLLASCAKLQALDTTPRRTRLARRIQREICRQEGLSPA